MIKLLPRSKSLEKIKRSLLVGLLVFWCGVSWGQTIGEFRSRQSGNWNDPNTWEQWNGSVWALKTGEEIFPIIAETATSFKTVTTGTTHTISLPLGIQSGDLLLIFWSDANTVNTEPVIPSGFTQLYNSTDGNKTRTALYKVANGSEGTSLNITAGAERSAHVTYRIAAGSYRGIPFSSTVASGTSTTSDPSNLAPGQGINKFLWLAALHTDGSSTGTLPSNYSNPVVSRTINPPSTNTDYGQMVVASRELEAASEDPEPFLLNTSTTHAAYTIGINSGFSSPNPISFPRSVFPTVVNTITGVSGNDLTSHSISLPQTSIGEMLVVIFSVDGDPNVTVNTGISGNNWTKLGQSSNGNRITGAVFWKISQGNDILTLTTNALERSSHIAYGIRDAVSISGTPANGNNINSNPPLHTPPEGTRDYMWIATRSGDGNNSFATAVPNGFSDLITRSGSTNNGANTSSAIRILNASSLDPGTFTSPNNRWVSYTLAIRGSGTATIQSSHTVVVPENVSVSDVTINPGGAVFINDGITFTTPINGTFNVNGIIQMGTNGTALIAGAGTFSLNSGGTLGITSSVGITTIGTSGNIQVSGTRTFNQGANYIYTGNTDQALGNGLPNTVNNLTIANSGTLGNNTVSLNANKTISSDLSITSGTFNIGTFTTNRETSGGNFTLAGNASLVVGGPINFPSNFVTNTIDCNSTVEYNGTSDQSIAAFNFGSLSLSGSGVKTLQTGTTEICSNFTLSGTATTTAITGLTIGGNVSIGTGTTFTAGSFTHIVGGNWTRAGTFNAGASMINFNGANSGTIQASTFNNLTFSGAGIKTASGNLTIGGNVIISNNFATGNSIHTIAGNWVNNGTFTSGTSTVSFTGASQQSLSGTASTTFYNLTINNGTGENGAGVLAGADLGVNGTLHLAKKDPNESNGLLEMVKNYGAYSNILTPANQLTETWTQAHDILDSWILNMGGESITTGVGSVTGKIKRINFENGVDYSFGHSNLSLTFTNLLPAGLPSEIMVIMTKGLDRGIHANKTNTVARLFQIIRTGGSLGTTFSIKLNYDESELNGNTENNLVLWDHHIPYVSANTPHEHGKSDQNITQNWVRLNNHSLFYLQTGEEIGGQTKYWMLSNTLIEGNNWLGAVNNNWNVTSNWTKGTIPTYEDNVIINDTLTAPRIPILPATGAFVKTLNILANGKLNGGNSSLTIYGGLKNNGGIGSWINNGTFIPGTSTVIFDYPRTTLLEDATVAGITEFYNLEIANSTFLTPQPNATIKIAGTLTNSGILDASSFNNTIEFSGNSPQTIVPNGTITGFYNLAFTGSGAKTINSTIPVLGDINPVAAPVILSNTNTLTLSAEKVMEITSSGSLTTQGNSKLILEPSARYINLSTSNPALEVLQEITGEKGWRMIGTPISTTYGELTLGLETQGFPGSTNPTLQPNLLWWDETDQGTSLQGWRQPANLTSNAPAGRGHYLYVFNGENLPAPATGNYSDALPKTISVSGTEVNLASGLFDFPVTFTARDSNLVAQGDTLIEVNQADQGFNMIANPTASTLDFYSSTGWDKTNIDETIYIWDPEVGEFLTWNGVTGDSEIGKIAPYQAFWIKANDSNPILKLTGNGPKSSITTAFYGRMLMDNNPTLQLNIAGEGLRGQSYITFGPDGKEGKDPMDAYRLESLAEDWLFLYSFGSPKTNSPLVINHQPELNGEDRVIPLHLAASKKGEPFQGTYLMDWKLPSDWPASTEIVLMDHINQKAIDMREENMYTFSLEAPKTPLSNARKYWNSMTTPQAVIFQTPYQTGEEDEVVVNSAEARISGSSAAKPKRPFSIYIGSFPDDRIEYLPELPKLFAPVPNPFRKETQIRFYLPVAEKAELAIYNLMGIQVGAFPSKSYPVGFHQIDWMPSAVDLPAGMYIIRLVTDKYSFSQKLIKN